ncbi:MAG: 5-(carboxyamino)imidazole ribonucleotide synthase [Myxococcota bacterium]
MSESASHRKVPTPRPGFPVVGVLGGGQLGRMLGLAALRLGLHVRFYRQPQSGSGPTDGVAEAMTGAMDDVDALRRFVAGCTVITLENEWVPLDTLVELLPADVPLWPAPPTMERVRDKIVQKQHAVDHDLPVGAYRACTNEHELLEAVQALGYPVVLKRPRHSYDGYGNATARDEDELRVAYERLRGSTGRVLVEAYVDFVRELAVMVARRPGGEDVAYPVVTTIQREHRCAAVEVPAAVTPAVAQAATELARRAAEVYGCVGVVGVEMFECPDGRLLLNEIAPRPHNTGHYTIEACVTSQFENHLRAVLDWPLGDASLVRPAAVMVNVLGLRYGAASAAALPAALAGRDVAVHVYGKRRVRPGRKMGHVTALGETLDDARARAHRVADQLEL